MVGTGTDGTEGVAVAVVFGVRAEAGSGFGGDADTAGGSGSSGGSTIGGSARRGPSCGDAATTGTCGNGGSPAERRAYTVTPAAATAAAATSQ
jgi:hypothetical protein